MAKALASEIGAVYIDTGAMYRAVTLYFIRNDINLEDMEAVSSALENIVISFDHSKGLNECLLNGENIESLIRTKEVSGLVSEVATISLVRKKLVEIQRAMSDHLDVVMDGRDIGTVVFPDAKVKLFITADPLIRAERRLKEYKKKGVEANITEVLENLKKRDYIDSNRKDSPLKVADDAIVIDNSKLTREEQLEKVIDIVRRSQEEDH
ncbi:cytidylate kinase [Portibacter lacus]|uniref:Cytidylate kinase n=2 Tax=Portibacter lacus TaxID=1099794 RepID=A0AA37SKA5_9BACT|nr:cytidylate kinase [Portibacter lacus]